jgi:hypothetical protein
MIEFKQKLYRECEAMRSLYVELMKDFNWRQKIGIIDNSSSLIPILRGNNIVIERFVISTSFLHSDKYRMYIKIGAKAKLPDEVRLPGYTHDEKLGKASININGGINKPKQFEFSEYNGIIAQKGFSKLEQREFDNGKGKKKNGNGNNNDGGGNLVKTSFSPSDNIVSITHEVQVLLGEAIEYNKKDRSLVLEFSSIENAVRALNILPFGINYKVYLLNV